MTDQPWVCPQCGYEWTDPKKEWVESQSCELCEGEEPCDA